MKKILLLTTICGLSNTASAMNQFPLDEQRQQQQQGSLVTLVFDTQPPQRLTLSRALAEESMTLKNILADLPAQGEIPVAGEHAAGITWLSKYHTGLSDQAQCSVLLNGLSGEDLGRVTNAAHYLEISGVSDMALATVGTRLMEDHNLQDNFLMSKQPEAYRPYGMQDELLKLALYQKKPLHDLLDDLKGKVGEPLNRFNDVAFSDDGSRAVVSYGHVFESWKKRNLGVGCVSVAVFAPDNKELFIGGQYGIVIINSSSKGAWKWTQRFDDSAAVTAIAKISPDRLVAGTDRRILKSFKKNTDGHWAFEQTLSNRYHRGLAQCNGKQIAYITTDNHVEMLQYDAVANTFVKVGDTFVDQTPFVGVAFDGTKNIACLLDERGSISFCKQDAGGTWQLKGCTAIVGDINGGGFQTTKEKYDSLYITQDGSMMVAGSDTKTRLLRHELHEHDAHIKLKLREFTTLRGINPVMCADGTIVSTNSGSYAVESAIIEVSGKDMTFAQLYLLMLGDAKQKMRGIDIADYPNLKALYDSLHPSIQSHSKHLVCESETLNEVRTSTHNKIKQMFTGLFGSAKK